MSNGIKEIAEHINMPYALVYDAMQYHNSLLFRKITNIAHISSRMRDILSEANISITYDKAMIGNAERIISVEDNNAYTMECKNDCYILMKYDFSNKNKIIEGVDKSEDGIYNMYEKIRDRNKKLDAAKLAKIGVTCDEVRKMYSSIYRKTSNYR